MSDATNYRQERIERLLDELRYEVTRGMMEGETDEHLGYHFIVPVSKTYPTTGVVVCEFRTRPMEHRAYLSGAHMAPPRLRVVGGKDAPSTGDPNHE